MTQPQIVSAVAKQFAPAKINLNLHVTGKTPQGYHLLDSVVVFADFGDELALSRATQTQLAISGPFSAGLQTQSNNLVIDAYDKLARELQVPLEPVRFDLRKNLPVASGIGGGSADAAAALRGLISLFDLEVSNSDLESLSLSLGADVPVCLAGRPVRMSGIGEKLQPIHKIPQFDAILVNPGIGVSTAAIFESLALKEDGEAFAALPTLPAATDKAAWIDWLKETKNDLQSAAQKLAPPINDVLEALQNTPSCQLARMSGSGATCFGLYPSASHAQTAARSLAVDHPDWWVQAVKLCNAHRP